MHCPPCPTLILDTHEFPSLSILFSQFQSVVIRYLHIVGITALPQETHSELIVDPNTVLAFPVMLQLF